MPDRTHRLTGSTPATLAVLLAAVGCGGPDLECESIGYVERGGTCVQPEADASVASATCAALGCEHTCDEDPASGPACGCPAGQRLEPDGKHCSQPKGEDLDADADGLMDGDDNCPQAANPTQADLDGDGLGDACDPDADGDQVDDTEDVCPGQRDEAQLDLDGDGLGDVCDPDVDGDGWENEEDPCPASAPTGDDLDGDGCLDAEDDDDDGDGLTDAVDGCPARKASVGDDLDGDGCPLAFDACPLGHRGGPDRDGDGCRDDEDPAPDDASSPLPPRIVHVRADRPPGEAATGSDWDTAFPYLRDGIDRAEELYLDDPSRTVHVWASVGHYYPDQGKRANAGFLSESFELRDGVEVYGGFDFDVDAQAWVRADLHGSVLDGDLGQNDPEGVPDPSAAYAADNACQVVRDETESGTAVLDGFAVTHGITGDDCTSLPSTGVLSQGYATFRNLLVHHNAATANGAGIRANRDSTWIHVRVEDNHTSRWQGGVSVGSQADAVFYGLRVRGNYAGQSWGGLSLSSGAKALLVNSEIAGNYAQGTAGAIDLQDGATLNAIHVTVAGNSCGEGAEVEYGTGGPGGARTFRNSILLQTSAPYSVRTDPTTHEDTYLVGVTESSLIDVPPAGAPMSTGDLRPDPELPRNPAVDRGDPDYALCPSRLIDLVVPGIGPLCDAQGRLRFDLDGNPRVQGAAPDVGAYETAP